MAIFPVGAHLHNCDTRATGETRDQRQQERGLVPVIVPVDRHFAANGAACSEQRVFAVEDALCSQRMERYRGQAKQQGTRASAAALVGARSSPLPRR
jgi:hypothetical protein